MTVEEFIKEHKNDDTHRLLLDAKRYVGIDVPFAVVQIEGRRRMASKLPEWCAMGAEFPQRLAMEQCSSEQTARYKRQLVKGESLVDLTGGFGVDCYYMGQGLKSVTYVEQNPELFAVVQRNYLRFGFGSSSAQADGIEVLRSMPKASTIYMDPARRDGVGRKMVGLADCEPNVLNYLSQIQEKCERLVLKLSPMIDIQEVLRQMLSVAAVHVIAVDGECKEVLVVCDWNSKESDVTMAAVNLHNGGEESVIYLRREENEAVMELANELETYLYEPNAAVLKAGAFKLLCSRYGLKKLHANTHLYTSNLLVEDFPGRKFQVEGVSGFSKNGLKELLNGVECANLTVRNFPEKVDTLRKRLRLRDGGDCYLFACTIGQEEKKLVKCVKALPPFTRK